jgi:hypothetical protein
MNRASSPDDDVVNSHIQPGEDATSGNGALGRAVRMVQGDAAEVVASEGRRGVLPSARRPQPPTGRWSPNRSWRKRERTPPIARQGFPYRDNYPCGFIPVTIRFEITICRRKGDVMHPTRNVGSMCDPTWRPRRDGRGKKRIIQANHRELFPVDASLRGNLLLDPHRF